MKLQKLLSYVRRAVDDYNMIEEGDRIAVGVSGGKDSLALVVALKALQRFYPKHFELVAISVNMGFEGMDFTPVTAMCAELGVEYHIVDTDIGEIIFNERKEKNPCSLCAKMRRGALNDLAKKNGFPKVALGHHQDDYVETFLLNLFFEGRCDTFKPLTYLDRMDITVIRPMLSVPEELIRKHSVNVDLPVVLNPCEADGHTRRDDMKSFLRQIESSHPMAKELAFRALERNQLGNTKGKWDH